MDKKAFGETLKNLRLKSGLEWNEIMNGLSSYGILLARSTMYGYEHGRSFPDPDVFLALCKVYGCKDILFEFGFTEEKDENLNGITVYKKDYPDEIWRVLRYFLEQNKIKK